MPELPYVGPWLYPFLFLLAGAVLGWLFEHVVVRRLLRLAGRTAWAWDDVVLRSLRRAPTLLGTAAGAWAASRLLPLSPGVERALGKFLMVLVIFSVTLVAARAAAGAIARYAARSGTVVPASSLVTNLARVVVVALGLLLILGNLGIEVTALITGLGIGGLAVALALQSTLSNAFAGFQILATRQVRHGDFVRLETGEEGYVVDIRWRNTTIKALYDDHEVIVPNSKLLDSILVNYSLPARPFWLRMIVGVSYGSDLAHVEEVALEVASDVWRELTEAPEGREPILRFREFGDSAITFSVRILVDEFAQQYVVRHEFMKRLHRRFGEEGIVIPWPIRTLHFPEPVRLERGEKPTDGRGERSTDARGEGSTGEHST